MTSNRLLAASVAATLLAALVFVVFPGLDLAVASLFWLGESRFAGDTSLGRGARHIGEALPLALMVAYSVLYGLRRFGGARIWAPSLGGVVMMMMSLLLGPELLVNVILKDHSHRPRPVQVADLGGPDPFRPFYRFDGACKRNCSFVSGEGSTAFWTLAPAVLTPQPYRAAAVTAALLFGTAVGVLRMAFGGHFLSDTVFAALFTWLVILACWRIVARLTGQAPDRQPPE